MAALDGNLAGALASGADDQAALNWERYEYAKQRGHTQYTFTAARNENFYFGGSTSLPYGTYNGYAYEYMGDGQWSKEGWYELQLEGRPSYTMNEIKEGVNSAVGYQIHNRLDITYRPAGGLADTTVAKIRSKMAMHILGRNKYHWKETRLFEDGLIEQRGYIDVRMNFDNNIYGDIVVELLDPRDVCPDPDAKTYDTKGWSDVTVPKWLTGDEIEGLWGKEARAIAEKDGYDQEGDHGEGDESARRNKFGFMSPYATDYYRESEKGLRRWRIIDRQRWVMQMSDVAVYPSGDVELVPDDASQEQRLGYIQAGAVIMRRMQRRVRWTVSTYWRTIFDKVSPYDRFTVIPYFPFFRRGRTMGMVDGAIDSQIILNKSISSYVHILNSSANSGWIVEQNSLTNMTREQLEAQGSMTGLVLEYRHGTEPPKKIEPNTVPTSVDKLIDRAYMGIKNATVPDAMRGTQGQEISGVAIQSRQFASQQALAIPIDNLNYTRGLVADFITKLIDTFYDNYRVFRVTETDPETGEEVDQTYEVNKYDELSGTFQNDLTQGKYDVVADSVPMQVTFENSQFQQIIEMMKVGVPVPPQYAIKYSNLSDKGEIMDQMRQQPSDPEKEAKAGLIQAQTETQKATAALTSAKVAGTRAEAANVRSQTAFALIQGAGQIVANPELAPVADQLGRSVGAEDQDAPPLIPTPALPAAGAVADPGLVHGVAPGQDEVPGASNAPINPEAPPAQNTSPQFPAHPASPNVGAEQGIEGGE